MTPKETALYWLDRGIATIPIFYRTKRPLMKWEKYQSELPTREDVNDWFGNNLCNLGIICGWNNLVVIDFDDMRIQKLWESVFGKYKSSTYSVRSNRGTHYYYYVDNPPPYTLKFIGGDVKSSGYVLAPPSRHPSGNLYKAMSNLPIMTIDNIHEVIPESLLIKPEPVSQLPCIGYNNNPFAPRNGSVDYDEIKHKAKITQILNIQGQASPNGTISIVCPFHDDHKKSAWINVKRNRFGCHACLNGSWSVIDVYCNLFNVDHKEAVSRLGAMI